MKNKLLIYDDNCPLCSWYSAQFVKFGFLPKEGRRPFSTIDTTYLNAIDFNRGRNEIPLIDTESKKVVYGIDSLLEILGAKIPVIKITGNSKPIHWLLHHLYKFISYNRKVIVAVKCGPGSIDCSPDFNYFYRGLFMSFFLMVNTLLLFSFHKYILSPLPFYHLSLLQLQAGHVALVLMNCLLALSFPKQQAFEYPGQVNLLALVTTLLLIPLTIINKAAGTNQLSTIIYLVLVTIIVFKEYFRRMEYAGIIQNNKWIASFNLAGMTGFILFLFS